jgi:hypothetical protein
MPESRQGEATVIESGIREINNIKATSIAR